MITPVVTSSSASSVTPWHLVMKIFVEEENGSLTQLTQVNVRPGRSGVAPQQQITLLKVADHYSPLLVKVSNPPSPAMNDGDPEEGQPGENLHEFLHLPSSSFTKSAKRKKRETQHHLPGRRKVLKLEPKNVIAIQDSSDSDLPDTAIVDEVLYAFHVITKRY